MISDRVCTGQNWTDLSARYYAGREQLAQNKTPLAASTCYQEGVVALPMQNLSSYQDTGCLGGFFCPNNSVNGLPQYCGPEPACGVMRLGGQNCNQSNGLYEPLLCPKGFYCPTGGMEKIVCPKGSFCPAGSLAPTACSIGSECGVGANKQMNFLALAVLLIVDVLIIAADLGFTFYSHSGRGKGSSHGRRRKKGRSWKPATPGFLSRVSGYKEIDDDGVVMEANINPLKRAPTTYQAAVDAEWMSLRDDEDDAATTDLSAFVKSLSRCMEGSDSLGLSFGFSNLSFTAGTKVILSDVTGYISRGSLVGVMGGSGAGKSTFVNVLIGKHPHTGGEVRVNGMEARISTYKKVIGHVPQDDVVLAELTVCENILFSGRQRLPSSWSEEEIQRHVHLLLICLELDHVKDSLVGSPAKPVVSGGQRKRVSIGMELVAAPMALFLDEPTSGLDATAAGSVMRILSALSRIGLTIITIIHQPRQEIFESIDDLILLGNGRLIYQGKGHDAEAYFENAGFRFPRPCNPADPIMDIITGNGRMYKPVGDVSKEALIAHWSNMQLTRQTQSEQTSANSQAVLVASAKKRGAHFYTQLNNCANRALLQQHRLKSAFWFEMVAATLSGFSIGLAQASHGGIFFHGIFYDNYALLSPALDFSSCPTLSLLVAVAIGLIASSPGVKIFGEEKLDYWREAAAGHNRVAYYLGKRISTLPRMLLGCFHFTTLLTLFSAPLMPYWMIFVTNLLYFYAIYGLATCISMVARREDGPLLATMCSLIVAILSGMAPSLANVTKWHLIWLWDASPGVWISEAYFAGNVGPMRHLYQVDMASEKLKFSLDRIGTDFVVLLAIGSIYRVVAYGLMVLVKRRKQR